MAGFEESDLYAAFGLEQPAGGNEPGAAEPLPPEKKFSSAQLKAAAPHCTVPIMWLNFPSISVTLKMRA